MMSGMQHSLKVVAYLPYNIPCSTGNIVIKDNGLSPVILQAARMEHPIDVAPFNLQRLTCTLNERIHQRQPRRKVVGCRQSQPCCVGEAEMQGVRALNMPQGCANLMAVGVLFGHAANSWDFKAMAIFPLVDIQ